MSVQIEYLDIINEEDKIISAKVPYEKVHATKAMHRVVHVLLLNDADEILLQLRSKKKKAFPLYWTFSAGGHVRHGESYEKALIREIKEELGITLKKDRFFYKGKGVYVDELGHKVVYQNYLVRYDGPIEVRENDEIETVQFVTWETLRQMILDPKEKVHSELVEVIKRHWSEYL